MPSSPSLAFSRRLILLGSLAFASTQRARTAPLRLPHKVRIAIAGFDGHVDEILGMLPSTPDVELTAVANAGSDRAAWDTAGRNPFVRKARSYSTLEDLLSNEKLDLVAICNNDGERAAAILACLDHNLHVIAEKPFAIDRASLEQVYTAARAKKLHVGMLLPMLFDPPYLAMKQIVESGEVGEVIQIDAQKSYQLGTRPLWQKQARTYGSTILWIGIHMFDLMTWTSGSSFDEVWSYQSRVRFPELGDMQNVTGSVLHMSNGGSATLRMDYLRPSTAPGHGDDRLRFAGTRGIVEYQESTGVTVISDRTPPRQLHNLPAQESVFADFLQQVYLGEPGKLTWPEIVRANDITLAAHESAVGHRPVRI